jgi:Mg2+ and Co2+ transporter CorA
MDSPSHCYRVSVAVHQQEQEVKHLITACEAADEAAEKYQRGQMDSTLYTLTSISAIFLPAQFLTGYEQPSF